MKYDSTSELLYTVYNRFSSTIYILPETFIKFKFSYYSKFEIIVVVYSLHMFCCTSSDEAVLLLLFFLIF